MPMIIPFFGTEDSESIVHRFGVQSTINVGPKVEAEPIQGSLIAQKGTGTVVLFDISSDIVNEAR